MGSRWKPSGIIQTFILTAVTILSIGGCPKKEDAEKRTIIETCTEKLPKLKLALQPGPDGKIMLLPEVNSVIDAAYYALARFMAVNTGALED